MNKKIEIKETIVNWLSVAILIIILFFLGILIYDNFILHQLLKELSLMQNEIIENLQNLENNDKKLAELEENANKQLHNLEENQKAVKKIVEPDPNIKLEWAILIFICSVGLYVIKTACFK